MRKAQVYSQIFIYILTIVLVSVILVYGYKSVQNFKSRADQISCIKFKNDITAAISSLLGDFGTTKIKEFQLCPGYSKVCFVESYQNPTTAGITDPIIRDSVSDSTGKNMFLIQDIAKESFNIGKISVNSNILCPSMAGDKIRLRLESKGDFVFISEP